MASVTDTEVHMPVAKNITVSWDVRLCKLAEHYQHLQNCAASYNETAHQLFIDFKKAYDLVMREVLYSVLVEFGVPMKLVRLIKTCLLYSHCFQLCFTICH
jgi:hypothetical protein